MQKYNTIHLPPYALVHLPKKHRATVHYQENKALVYCLKDNTNVHHLEIKLQFLS